MCLQKLNLWGDLGELRTESTVNEMQISKYLENENMQTKTVQYNVKYDDVIEYKRRKSARLALHRALWAKKVVKPECCDLCQESNKSLDGHHIDYGKPLDVKWLCKKCHGIAHSEGHAWNPDCNEQTNIDEVCLNKDDFIRVNFTIPVDQYLALMMECDKKNISVACRLRQILIENDSLNETMRTIDDEPQHEEYSRVQSLEPNETGVSKSKVKPLSKSRCERSEHLQGMEGGLWPILSGNGANARELQRAR